MLLSPVPCGLLHCNSDTNNVYHLPITPRPLPQPPLLPPIFNLSSPKRVRLYSRRGLRCRRGVRKGMGRPDGVESGGLGGSGGKKNASFFFPPCSVGANRQPDNV